MRRPSPALVVSIAALVVALGGTAVAAKKYVVTSTKQISPKVLQQLRGRTGPMGPTGLQGPRGSDGTTGVQGADGAAGPSNIVSATRTSALVINGTVATLTALPAGSWLIVATLYAYGGNGQDVTCELGAGSFNPPGSTVTVGVDKVQVTTSAAVTLASPANIALTCDPGTASPSARGVRLYAIRTGELDNRSLD
jgi:hypothetical protein